MKVAADGRHQVVLGACLQQLLVDCRRIVTRLRVVHLQPVDPGRQDSRQVRAPVLAVQFVRVRPRREAADRVDESNPLHGLQPKALEVRRPAVADETLEGFVDRLNVAGLEQRLRHVGTPDATLASDLEDALQADRRPESIQRLDHLRGPLQPRLAEPTQRLL